MNPTANDATANNPDLDSPGRAALSERSTARLPAVPPRAPRASGSSTLKYLIPVFVLVAVVFGITFFSQYTPPSDEMTKAPKANPQGSAPPLLHERPQLRSALVPSALALSTAGLSRAAAARALGHDRSDPDFPFRFSPQDRVFPGFYEPKDDAAGLKHSTTFWFENPHSEARHDGLAVRELRRLQRAGESRRSRPT